MSAQSQVSHPEVPVLPAPPLAGVPRPESGPIPQPNFGSRHFKADPFGYYARLRREAPVFQLMLFGRQRGWLVTRYDDVVAVLKHPSLGKDRFSNLTDAERAKLPWFFRYFQPLMQNMLERDPPDHTRLRGLVHKAFTPHLVERLRGRIQELTNQLLDAAVKKGRMDLVADYALPLPVTIIADMLGIPDYDRAKFHKWSSKVISNTNTLEALIAIPAVIGFTRYIRKLVEKRRASPGDDLLTGLIQAEEAGDRLSQDELVSMVFLILVAGHETTVNLIANGMLALLQHPDQLERLRKEPALIGTAVEELLRFTCPVELATMRVAREDFELSGAKILRGDYVAAVIASANRDEQHFSDPDALDVGRDPNRHLGFGMGIHYCLGAPLARLEGAIAIQNAVQRLPNLRLTVPVEKLRWRTGFVIRGLRKLPVAF
ncbi:MAG TPA: cytochrome P450 [Myxococcaceae bacterium]|nr:cytochrome P450 [Myxococcaceae bacterium]